MRFDLIWISLIARSCFLKKGRKKKSKVYLFLFPLGSTSELLVALPVCCLRLLSRQTSEPWII